MACSKGEEKAYALFDQACDDYASGDSPTALSVLRQAIEITHDDSLKSQIYSLSGNILMEQGVVEDALTDLRKAFYADSVRNDTLGMAYDLRDIGNALRMSGHAEDCEIMFIKSIRYAEAADDSLLAIDAGSQLAGYYLYNDDTDKAAPLLMKAKEKFKEASDEENNGLLFLLADMYKRMEMDDSAAFYYKKLMTSKALLNRQASYLSLAQIAANHNDYPSAIEYIKAYDSIYDSVFREIDAEAVRKVNALYNYQKQEAEKARLQKRSIYVWLVSVIVIALLTLTSIFLFFMAKNQKKQKVIYSLRLRHLQELTERSKTEAEQRTRQQTTMSAESSAIYKRLQVLIYDKYDKVPTDEEWDALDQTVNEIWPDFTHKLSELCKMSLQEQRVCMLLKMGISPSGIAKLTARTKQSITAVRTRLYSKTFGQSGMAKDWDEFIESL